MYINNTHFKISVCFEIIIMVCHQVIQDVEVTEWLAITGRLKRCRLFLKCILLALL